MKRGDLLKFHSSGVTAWVNYFDSKNTFGEFQKGEIVILLSTFTDNYGGCHRVISKFGVCDVFRGLFDLA